MRTPTLLIVLLCVALCSCERSPKVKLGGVGDDPTWISSDETRRVGEQLITNRYPRAQIVEELGMGQIVRYRFATNDRALPMSAVVDRKTGKARFESSNQ
jgi:hypothetical protein